MENAELGIALTDTAGAKTRGKAPNGLESQHSWSRRYLTERTLAGLFALCLVATLAVWISDTSTIVRVAVTGAVVLLGVVATMMYLKQRAQLLETRRTQMQAHSEP